MSPPAEPSPDRPQTLRLAVWIFVAFAIGHFLSYALRTVNAALAPYLVNDLQLSAASLGWLSSAYFVSFAILQYPLGFWLDRYGERKVEASLLLVAAAGALLMALASSLGWLSFGRALIGVGVSACLMAPFAWFRRVYSPQRQSQLGLWLLMAGTSGAAISTLPAATLAEVLGWRGVFMIFAVLLFAAAVLIYLVVPERKPKATPSPALRADTALKHSDSPGSAAAVVPKQDLHLIRDPVMLHVMALAFFGHGGMMALHTLWAGPWMTQVLGIAPTWAATYLFVFTLTMMVAYLLMSFLAPWLQRRNYTLQHIAFAGHACTVTGLLAIALLPYAPAWWLWPVIALCFPAMSLMQPALSLSFPRSMAGRVMTLYNLYVFAGAFVVQWGIGLLIDLLQSFGISTPAAYQMSFLTLVGVYILSLLWWRWHTNLKPTPIL